MSSTFQIEHNRLFGELREVLKTDIARITGKANGGRSILFVYPPEDDDAYIAYARENFNSDEYSFIDLRTLFTEFVSEQGIEQFQENYKEFGNEVFFSDNFYEETFFYYIIKAIENSYQMNKIPVLVHTGAIYGMGFSNINIMEHRIVMSAQLPLIAFYPATVDNSGEASQDLLKSVEISYDDLRYVHIRHYNFEGNPAEGELICNKAIAQDLTEIFYELYCNEYQLEKVLLIDEYDGDDLASMEDNNTSCFNYRPVEGTSSLSKHALGLAIDINPFYNPYITYNKDGSERVSPANASAYADRTASFPYKIDENDLCYQLFKEHGFTWGGHWNSCKDYQHFQKVVE